MAKSSLLRFCIALHTIPVRAMRLPFNRGLVVGVDITQTTRFLNWEARRHDWRRLWRLTNRLMTDSEHARFASRYRLTSEGDAATEKRSPELRGIARHVAGRWAAKEAAMKAWGADLLSWKDLEVVQPRRGKPSIVCSSGITSDDPNVVTSQEGELSISHDGVYAVAHVLAESLHADIVSALKQRKAEAAAKVESAPSVKSEEDEDINIPFSTPTEDLGTIIELGQK